MLLSINLLFLRHIPRVLMMKRTKKNNFPNQSDELHSLYNMIKIQSGYNDSLTTGLAIGQTFRFRLYQCSLFISTVVILTEHMRIT